MAGFHAEKPGITEHVLSRSFDANGVGAYRWLAEGISTDATVLDLACGSAPTRPFVGDRWVGTDLSASELAVAIAEGRSAVVRSDALRLPIAAGSIDVLICSMALMLLDPLHDVLREIQRVLASGGEVRALVRATHPMTLRDRWSYLRVMQAVRLRPVFPRSELDGHTSEAFDNAGLTLRSDEFRRFAFPVNSTDDLRQFVSSWYTPGHTPTESATKVARLDMNAAPNELAVPLRRLIATSA